MFERQTENDSPEKNANVVGVEDSIHWIRNNVLQQIGDDLRHTAWCHELFRCSDTFHRNGCREQEVHDDCQRRCRHGTKQVQEDNGAELVGMPASGICKRRGYKYQYQNRRDRF